MKNISRISILVSLLILASCVKSTPQLAGTDNWKGCSQSEGCETVVLPGPFVTAAQPLIQTPAKGSRYYYVSPQGDDSNFGTKTSPFLTIGKAAQLAQAGDVVLIRGGIYYEDVKPAFSGESGKYITYQNDGIGDVIIDAEDGKRPGCIEIDNKSFLQIIGITVRGANSYQSWPRSGISITDGSTHIILNGITAYDNYFGIMARGNEGPVSFITVTNTKTFGPDNIGNVHYGIFFYEKVYDSQIINNRVAYTLPEEQSYGIEISTNYPGVQENGARRVIVAGNEVDHNESEGIHTWNATGVLISGNFLHENGATGIQIEDGSENIIVEHNLSETNAQTYEFEAGVWIDDSKNVVVRNNILRSNKVGLIVTASDRVIVHDNYLYLNNRGAENLYNAAGLIAEDLVSNISVTHNTFYGNGAGSAAHGAINFGLFNPSCSDITFKNNIVAESMNDLDLLQDTCDGFVSDFNDFFNTRPLAVEWNQSQMDWTMYRIISGQDSHSLTSAPIFADPDAFDFSLQATSPLIGKGSILAWTTSAGSGDTIPVTDAGFFSDGFGMGSGDSIVIGDHLVNIVEVNYVHRSIRVDRAIQWGRNDPVSFPFDGATPDMGVNNIQ